VVQMDLWIQVVQMVLTDRSDQQNGANGSSGSGAIQRSSDLWCVRFKSSVTKALC
jgi:hypothetical protein